uniref:Uncharacterized protein n=1 Tax=Arion vulgaris TaxID=1028688 RepID=A0A0B6Z9D9_9EUPU
MNLVAKSNADYKKKQHVPSSLVKVRSQLTPFSGSSPHPTPTTPHTKRNV